MPEKYSDLSHIKIDQLEPKGKDSSPDQVGWGFETDKYRVVIYGPREANTRKVNEAQQQHRDNDYHRRRKYRAAFAEAIERSKEIEHFHTNRTNRKELDNPVKQPRKLKQQFADHPPAHVHVIQLQPEKRIVNKYRDKTVYPENRYELIESSDGKCRAILMEPTIKEDGSMSNRARRKLAGMINKEHEPEIQRLLNATAAELVACWRKLYSPENFTEAQISKNPLLGAGFDQYVTQEKTIKTPAGKTHAFHRRLEGDGIAAYYRLGSKKPYVRIISDPDDKSPTNKGKDR